MTILSTVLFCKQKTPAETERKTPAWQGLVLSCESALWIIAASEKSTVLPMFFNQLPAASGTDSAGLFSYSQPESSDSALR